MKAKSTKHKPALEHEEGVIESFRKNPELSAAYLNAVLKDGGQKELMVAMRRMAEAFGGVSELAKKTNLHAKTLYRTLSPQGNPELKSLTRMLEAMGMQLAVKPSKASPCRRRQVVKTT